MFDSGNFAVGAISGFGASILLAGLFKHFLERGIENWFKVIQQSREIIGRAQIEHRRTQLSELYGPLYAYLKSSDAIYELWVAGKLHGINEDIKVRFRAANEAMMQLIGTKSHLIDEAEFPKEMAHFVSSIAIWNMYTLRQDGLPDEVAALPAAKFPREFRDYVFRKTEELKKTLESLYSKYAVK